MAIKVKPWDVGVKPRIVKGRNGRYSCQGGGVTAFGWNERSAYIIWQKGRIFHLSTVHAQHVLAAAPQGQWLTDQPFVKTY